MELGSHCRPNKLYCLITNVPSDRNYTDELKHHVPEIS